MKGSSIDAIASQRKWQSLIESVVNVIIGFVINVTAQAIVFPWFGIHIPLSSDIGIGLVFTVISVVRSFTLRRVFNKIHVKTVHG